MQRSNLLVLLVLGLLAALGHGTGLRGLQQAAGEEPKASNVTAANPPSNQTAQVNATRAGEQPAGAGGNETRVQGQGQGQPANASEANSTKHIVVVGRPYYGGYGYPYGGGCGGYYGGCGYGYGWRRHLRGTAAEQRANATTPSNATAARPGQERRPPAANVTSEEQQGQSEQRGNVTAANQTEPVEAGKDGWWENGHWHERGGWNDHDGHGWHRGWDHHDWDHDGQRGGWRDQNGQWHWHA